jgi:8-oxo-dGTP pyrophosphatase MutT (NUDIX family)
MYKVYFENRLLTLSSLPDQLQNYCLLHKYHDPKDLSEKITDFLNNSAVKCVNIHSEKAEHLWSIFKENFHFLEASGGIVMDNKKRMLLIKRYKRWDAPKGHFEPCETPEMCARREIEEECGIVSGNTIAELSPGYHLYRFDGQYYLKKTFWYLFGYEGKGDTKPQEEEGITQVEWIARDTLDTIRTEMWHSVQDVLTEILENHFSQI